MTGTFPGRQTVVTASLLALALLAASDLSSIRHWIQVAVVCLAYCYCCSITAAATSNSRWTYGLQLATAVSIALAWIVLNRITAIYFGGGLLLGLFLLGRVTGSDTGRISSRDLAIPALLVAAALLVSEITISRITINLSSLAVPSKFQLHSDAGAGRQHHASRGYPLHVPNPVRVQLGADHLALDEPMPWLQFQARRDTLFPIQSVQYRFFNIIVHEISATDLHQLKLDHRSDDVTLDKVAAGITINNIGANESAWLQLPGLQDLDPGLGTIVKVTVFRVLLWLLVCLVFLCWQPMPAFTNRQQ